MTPDIDIELTVEEQSAIDEQAAEVAAAANPAPVAEVVPEVVPDPVEAKPDPALAAIAENSAATRALAEQLAAQQAAAAEAAKSAPVVEQAPPPRDFDAEFAALQTKYDDGDIDAAEHARALRALTKEESAAETARLIAEADAKRASEAQAAAQRAEAEAKASEDAKWNAATEEFFKDPGNAKLVADPDSRTVFEAHLAVAARNNPGASYTDLLVKARESITGVPAVDTTKAVKDAEFERTQNAGTPAQTLREIPNSGNPGGDASSVLDNMPIEQLEDVLARMPEAERNRYLAGAPGNEQRSAA